VLELFIFYFLFFIFSFFDLCFSYFLTVNQVLRSVAICRQNKTMAVNSGTAMAISILPLLELVLALIDLAVSFSSLSLDLPMALKYFIGRYKEGKILFLYALVYTISL